MSVDTPLGDEGMVELRLRQLETHLTDTISYLEDRMAAIRGGADQLVSGIDGDCRGLLKAKQSLIEMRRKIEEDRKAADGRLYGDEHDFEAVREAIGIKLDRLRAAAHSGDIPQ